MLSTLLLPLATVFTVASALNVSGLTCAPDSVISVVQDDGQLRYHTKVSAVDNAFFNRYLQIFTDKVVPCNGFLERWHFKPTASHVNGVHLLVLRNYSNTFSVVLDTHITNLHLPTANDWVEFQNENTDPQTFVQAGDVLGIAYDLLPDTRGGVIVRSKVEAFRDEAEIKEAYQQRRTAQKANTMIVQLGAAEDFIGLGGRILLSTFQSAFEWRQAFLDADITSYPSTTTTTSTPQAANTTAKPTTTAQRCSSSTRPIDLQCSAQTRRYRYDFESGSCQTFDGCVPALHDTAASSSSAIANSDGGNNFGSWADCVRACSIFRCGQYPISATNVYPCKERRWYYNVQVGRCQTFIGCDAGPERNNFGSENECMQFCTAYPFVSNWRPVIESKSASEFRRRTSSSSGGTPIRHQ